MKTLGPERNTCFKLTGMMFKQFACRDYKGVQKSLAFCRCKALSSMQESTDQDGTTTFAPNSEVSNGDEVVVDVAVTL